MKGVYLKLATAEEITSWEGVQCSQMKPLINTVKPLVIKVRISIQIFSFYYLSALNLLPFLIIHKSIDIVSKVNCMSWRQD